MTIDLEQNIRERAYAIWERQGRLHGRHDEHWHAAKLELTGAVRDASSIAVQAPDAAPPSPAEKPKKSRRRAAPGEPPAANAAPPRRRAPARPAQ
jgi:hypothetical protein